MGPVPERSVVAHALGEFAPARSDSTVSGCGLWVIVNSVS